MIIRTSLPFKQSWLFQCCSCWLLESFGISNGIRRCVVLFSNVVQWFCYHFYNTFTHRINMFPIIVWIAIGVVSFAIGHDFYIRWLIVQAAFYKQTNVFCFALPQKPTPPPPPPYTIWGIQQKNKSDDSRLFANEERRVVFTLGLIFRNFIFFLK